jgi:hypothetical protein
MMEATSYSGTAEAFGGQVTAGAASDEERLAEVVVELIRKDGRVRQAIMDLVLSSPYVKWEL